MTFEYQAPERLERDWREGRRTPPDEMLEELRPHVDELREAADGSGGVVAVQGRISDYKSWLAAAAAKDMADDGLGVTLFSPQTANRESAVDKLALFGAEYIDHPSRLDLCIWDDWRENVGYVDKTTCSANGCPYFIDSEEDIAERSADGLSSHVMRSAGIRLSAEEMREIGSRTHQDMCPAQFHLEVRGSEMVEGAVNTATYAKAFQDAAVSPDDPLDSDVVLLDEAHTIAADPSVVSDDVEPRELTGSLETVIEELDGSAGRWSDRAAADLSGLLDAVGHWLELSEEEHADPDEIFAGESLSLGDSFETLEGVESRLIQRMRRATLRGDWSDATDVSGPHNAVRRVRGFLSRIQQYRDGNADFVHSLYTERGEQVNHMAFRSVDETVGVGDGTTPGAVYREWQDAGTHPVIADRWGPVLDHHIESLWDGRAVRCGGDMPGAPVMPVDRLREIAGAETVITLSATHNELSDPNRPPGSGRPTRHDLLCAPVYLRTDGSQRRGYDGRDSVSPDTPWFRDLVGAAKEASGDSLAAVPVNFRNLQKWEALPVERLEIDGEESAGVVPHSRGSIGEKGLEDAPVDTVLCGIQVQSPGPTARRLVQWWELLAPRFEEPEEVLAASWRLLAQHAVSGTIQAGGRFAWDATNLVFERPGLFELAGFDVGVATPDSPGFAGELCRIYERERGEWHERRSAVRAARVIGYLEDADRKSATVRQAVGEYRRIYDCGDEQARRAIWLASERRKIKAAEADGPDFETT